MATYPSTARRTDAEAAFKASPTRANMLRLKKWSQKEMNEVLAAFDKRNNQ